MSADRLVLQAEYSNAAPLRRSQPEEKKIRTHLIIYCFMGPLYSPALTAGGETCGLVLDQNELNDCSIPERFRGCEIGSRRSGEKRWNMKSAADDTCYCALIGPRKLQQMQGCVPAGNVRDLHCWEVQSCLVSQQEQPFGLFLCSHISSLQLSQRFMTRRAYGSVLMTLERFNLGKAGGGGGGVGGCRCYLYRLQPGPSP